MTATGSAKAVFIDGQSLNQMKPPLGIDLFDFPHLYQCLRSRVGTNRPLAHAPIITVHPALACAGSLLLKQLSGAGFEPLPVESKDGADDDALKERIDRLNPAKVSEVVVVTSDKDLIPVLLAKASQGMQIHWVATMSKDPRNNQVSVSRDVVNLCHCNPAFSFFELRGLRRFVGVRCRGESASTAHSSSDSRIAFRLTLQSDNMQLRVKLGDALRRLELDLPGLRIELEH